MHLFKVVNRVYFDNSGIQFVVLESIGDEGGFNSCRQITVGG